jgi:hypothetical protein
MNEHLKGLIDSIGVLCEVWTVSYQKFISLGFDHTTAIQHTSEFTKVLMAEIMHK